MNNQESISGAKALKEAKQRMELAKTLKILDYSQLHFNSGKLEASFFKDKRPLFPENLSDTWHYVCLGQKSEMKESHLEGCRDYAAKRQGFTLYIPEHDGEVALFKPVQGVEGLEHASLGYDLRLMSNPTRIEPKVLYIKDLGDKGLQYTVKYNNQVITDIINTQDLSTFGISIPFPKYNVIKKLKPKLSDILNITSKRGHTPSLSVQCMLAKLDVFINKLPLSGRLFVLNHPESYEVRELLTLLKTQVDNENAVSLKPNTTAIENYFTNPNIGLIPESFLEKITCAKGESKISKVLGLEPATMKLLLVDNATSANALFAKAFWGRLCMHQGESNMALGACVYHEFLSATNNTYTQDILNWKNEEQQTKNTQLSSHFRMYGQQRETEGNWGLLDIILGLFMFTQDQKQKAVAAIKNAIKDDKFGSLSKIPQDQHGALLQGRLGELVHALMDQSQYHRVHQQAQRSGFYWLRVASSLKDERAIRHRKDCLDNINKVVESKTPIDKFHETIAFYEESGLTQVTVKDNKDLFDALNTLFDSTRGSDNFHRLLHDELLAPYAKKQLIQQFMLPKMDGNLLVHQLLRKKSTALESYNTCPLGNELATKLLPLLQWSDASLEKTPHPETLTEIQKISLFCNHYKPLITTYLTDKTIGGQSLVGDNQKYLMAMLWYELFMAGLHAFDLYDTEYGKNILAVSNDLCQHQKQKLCYKLSSHAHGIGFNIGMMRTLESICTLGTVLSTADIKLRDQVMKIGEKFKHEEDHADNTVILSVLCVGTMLLGVAHAFGGVALLAESAFILDVNAKTLAKIPKWIKSAIHGAHTMHHFFEHEPTGKFINSTLPALYEVCHIGEHGLKLWGPHAHYGAHDNHAHGNHAYPQWENYNDETAQKYKTARDSINPKTLYMSLSDLLMPVSPIKHDAITLIMMHFAEIYKPVTSKLRATDAFLLGDFLLSLILQGFQVRLAMVDMRREQVAQLKTMEDLFTYLDELLWCYAPLLSHEHTLLMTQSGQAVSILDLIYPPKLQVISNNTIHHLSIEPSLLPKRPQHVPLNTKLLRHASTYEIQTYKKLLSLDKDDKQTYGFSLQSLDKAERVHDASPSFTCVIDLKTQVSDLNKSNRLQLLDNQGQKYIKAMEEMLKKLEKPLNINTDVIGKLTESKERLSILRAATNCGFP